MRWGERLSSRARTSSCGPASATWSSVFSVGAASAGRPAHELEGLQLQTVRSRSDSSLWNEFIDRDHYLGHKPLPGARMRCFACWQGRILALLGFGAAAWKTAPRDRFIGWLPGQRESCLHLIANNAHFLILPWVQSKNLASKVLAMAARRLPEDWLERYAYRPVLLETFVDDERFTGACCKAAGWIAAMKPSCLQRASGCIRSPRHSDAH